MTRQEKFEDYEGFVEKFKPKKTTDDCYTPPEIYEVVKNYACERWNIDPEKVVRPFWPGGDYEKFDYSNGAVVIDNPPFSILSKITGFYLDNKIPFFLFAPLLTIMNLTALKMNHIVCDSTIIYENGARVKTSFVTSYGLPNILETCPELTKIINDKTREITKRHKKELPKYIYPNEVITSAGVQKYNKYGIEFKVKRDEAIFIKQLDAQREKKKTIYGGGLLVSSANAAERAVAERAVAERAVVERWQLSEREREIVKQLSCNK